MFECPPYTRVSEISFFHDLLDGIGSSIVESGRKPDKRGRLINHFHDRASESSYASFVLFIDEAQNLLEGHYKWLIFISNCLKKRGVDLIVLLIGQDELFAQRSSFVQAKKSAIYGRFMSLWTKFHGIQSQAQLRACLTCYDDVSEYPEGSGFSFTRFFLPKAFDAGWRIAEAAPMLWSIFREASKSESNVEEREIPMQHFCRAVEFVILELANPLELSPKIDADLLKKAVASSGYAQQFAFHQVR